MNPSDDPTSIGAILVSMGAVTTTQVEEVVEEQRRLREDALLGRLLVAKGYCTQKQFDVAMAAQNSMRNGGKERRALTVADISLARARRHSVIATRQRIIEKGAAAIRSITGTEYPAITPAVLAKRFNGE
jgi:hypothetical protein